MLPNFDLCLLYHKASSEPLLSILKVHLCEAVKITDFLGDDFLINRTSSKSMLVAVKMLRRDADDNAR